MRTGLKAALAGAYAASGALRRLHAGRLVILTFHRVRPGGEGGVDRPMRNLEVEAADFRRMLVAMRERYEPIALGDWIRQGQAPLRASFAVTFDDGWADNAEHALPILRELGIPSTVFLATGAVEERRPFWWQGAGLPDAEIERRKRTGPAERDGAVPPGGEASHDFLTWGQIREMGASGLVTFGPHGHRHELLDQMSRDEALADIRQSWLLLQERIPEWIVPVLAWPNGNARDDVGGELEDMGLQAALGTRRGAVSTPGGGRWNLPRNNVDRQLAATPSLLPWLLLRAR